MSNSATPVPSPNRWHTPREGATNTTPVSTPGSAACGSATPGSASSMPLKRSRAYSPDPFFVTSVGSPPSDRDDQGHCPSPPPKPQFTPSFPNCIQSTITHNEYCVLGTIYKEIMKAPPAVMDWFDAIGTIQGVRREVFSLKALTDTPPATIRTGRPVKEADESTGALIMSVIEQINKEGSASSIKEVKRRVEEQFQMTFSQRTLHRRMTELGCYWGAGTRINKNHDSEANVKYRRKYLERRLANLKAVLNKNKEEIWIPRHPEVFLDESYCHLDHTAPNRRVIPGSTITEPGHSPLLVIFAAFVVWYDNEEKELKAEFVDESVYVWPSNGKAHTKSGKGAYYTELWNNVPEIVRKANVVAPTNDYHGNFTAKVFDGLFTRICEKLQGMGLLNCRIHLDGASYHFHKTTVKPEGKGNLQDFKDWAQTEDVQTWLRERGIVIPEKPKKVDIQKHAKIYVDEATWSIYDIARRNGNYIIRKTPPYHCELQPIEKIWACIKNKVAATTNGRHTLLSLKQTLDHLFFSISQETFLAVWRGSIEQGRKYWFESEKEREGEGEQAPENDTQDDNNANKVNENNRSNNDIHHAQHKQKDAPFDVESILGDLTVPMWTMTLNTLNNKGILFDSTPNGHNDDEEAGVDTSIVEVEEEEEEPFIRNRSIPIFSLVNLTNYGPIVE